MSEHSDIPGKTVPQAHRSHAAQARKEIRDQRSPQEQIKELDSRPGNSTKERRRLTKQIEKS